MSNILITQGGSNVSQVFALTTNPTTDDVYIVYTPMGVPGSMRRLGTIDVSTGIITDLGDLGGQRIASISFDNMGEMYGITGAGGGAPTISETLFNDFPCVIQAQPPSDIPTLSQWGIIILGLLFLIFGVVSYPKVSESRAINS